MVNGKTITNNNLSLVENSNVIITQDVLNSYAHLYYAFSSCKFKADMETEYTALYGNTEVELRNYFVAKYTAQGINPPTKSEYNETLPMYHWVFAQNASFYDMVLAGGVIHRFETHRFVYSGYTSLSCK